jgi:CubicO group peptidase (beta-lactamase class C family)
MTVGNGWVPGGRSVWRAAAGAIGSAALGATLLAAGAAGASAQLPGGDARSRVEGIQAEVGEGGLGDRTLQQLMSDFGVPGVSIAVIQDFEILWARGYGIADIETRRAVDTETMFQAASISKPVAAMAMMRAVQDGVFGLDDDINDILTSWTLDGDGFTESRPVTPRTLTSHTSGLGDGFGFPGYEPDTPLPSTVQILDGHGPSNVGPIFMEREPMTFFEYSGGGVTVMQLALADARGRPFEEILQSDVLDPIGMTRSSYDQPIDPERDRNAARAHGRDGASMGAKWHVYPEQAAAGLWTTPTDLARFAIEVQNAYRGTSDRVLSKESVSEMLSPVGVGSYAVGFELTERGQGWYFAHGGSNWGFRALLMAHKVKGYGLAVMTNGSQGSDIMVEILRRVENEYQWDSVAEPVQRGR